MVLIIDDDAETRSLLTTILAQEGYDVRAADGGELAFASLSVVRPELVLLDIRMPGIDGLEVCRRLKSDAGTRDIPVIFLSASEELSERVEGFRLGGVDFVPKPFQREELLARVRTHLELGRLRASLEAQVEARTGELRESEERFRTMANSAPVMIWASGVDKQRTFFNRGWLEFTGGRLEDDLGDGWARHVHRDDQSRCYATYSSSFDERREFQMEYRLRRADGEFRWVLDSGVPRFTPDGSFCGYVGSCTDITDLKQNHERVLASQKLESLGVMAAGVAHDFGNLLASVFAEVDLALEEMPPEAPGRESVQRIAAVATYAKEIVKMLMDSAGAGIETNALEPVDVSALVEQTLRLLARSISKLAVVRTCLATGLPLVYGNASQIRQVVLNLITNACESLGGMQGVISVATENAVLSSQSSNRDPVLTEGAYVRLKVADTGCGMTTETRARIFDQFFTTKSYGRGLGLAAVHGIVRSHNGAINVVSAPGAGTTFEILLPCIAHGDKSRSAADSLI